MCENFATTGLNTKIMKICTRWNEPAIQYTNTCGSQEEKRGHKTGTLIKRVSPSPSNLVSYSMKRGKSELYHLLKITHKNIAQNSLRNHIMNSVSHFCAPFSPSPKSHGTSQEIRKRHMTNKQAHLMMTHWLSFSINMFLNMLSVSA